MVLTPGPFDPEFASCTLGFSGVLKRFFDPRSFLLQTLIQVLKARIKGSASSNHQR